MKHIFLNRFLVGAIVLQIILWPSALAQIPYGAPATSTLLNSTFGAKGYANTWTAGNTFSGALLAPTMTFTDNSTNVATTAFVKGQNYITSSGAPVQSVFGRTGTITATSGDYTTALVTESGSLYFTNARAIGSTLTGWASTTGAITSSDTVLTGIEKNAGNLALKADAASPTITGTASMANASLSGTLGVTGLSTLTGGLSVGANFILSQQVDSTTTGASAALSVTKPTIVVTNASLTSVGSISSPTAGQTVILVNKTGASFNVLNEDSGTGTGANRILTGTGANLALASNASVILSYQSNDSRWHVVGGSGSGGSGTQYNSSAQVIDTGTKITLTSSSWQVFKVSGSTAPFVGTIAFQDSVGGNTYIPGTVVTLMGTSDTLTFTLTNSATTYGLNLNGDCELKNGDTLTVMFFDSDNQWHEISRSIR